MVLAFFVAATALMTWPQAWHLGSAVADHDDTYFSMWRLGWVAHQLPRDPAHLFDTNVFFPARWTLAYSDATLLEGLVAAVPLWLGVHPIVVYNVLFLGAIALSGFCAYALALKLTRDAGASLVAGFVFAFAPYRFGHIGHLELQWTMWMPLALLAVHAVIRRGRLRDGAALGACVALQGLSSVYYVAFLSVVLAAFVLVLFLASDWTAKRRLVRGGLVAAVVTAAVLVPYVIPYREAREIVGTRPQAEVARFSARPSDYLHAGRGNWWHRARIAREDWDERSLYPGIVAPVFAVAALWPPLTAWPVACAAAAAVAFDGSLGPRGLLVPTLRRGVPALDGLRSAARFGVLVLLFLAMLGATGLARVRKRLRPRLSTALVASALAISMVEFWSAPVKLQEPVRDPPAFAKFLKRQPDDTIVLHVPVPNPHATWLYETTYQYLSVFHWRTLINGYSGYAPPDYIRTLDMLQTFPDEASIGRLRRMGVDFVIVHPHLLRKGEHRRLADRLDATGAFALIAAFRGAVPSDVYQLLPDPAATSTAR